MVMAFTGPVADRLALRELLDSYSNAVMEKDAPSWSACWAEDAFWALPEVPDLEGFSGREAIVAAWVQSMDVYGLDNCTRPMIYVTTPGSIAVDGDVARGTSYTSEIYQDPHTGKELRVRGRYEDEMARIDGRWVFTRRTYRVLHTAHAGEPVT
ncbi:nuclear transport factor 2 family protein [Croceicoccus sp. F390]|uniref:Nuclear transport factor 2 family protein n=1 Tax=Croceicoccus esteveae TaxID=3075597 RepID=A0ABU2ZIY8_9SPHN|nr:nuclear transport factor 2 family protein [Croceicoccus sp. F390]MDT0575988.1 nuclear transport factor 2 family protein [Croceicoccus sp. F390]